MCIRLVMKEVKKGICLWVYSECPTDAQREELLNARGASEIIEDVGVELFNRRLLNGYYKSNDDTILFFSRAL